MSNELIPVMQTDIPNENYIIVKESCLHRIIKHINNQNFIQHFNIIVSFFTELYRIITGSLLLLSVPLLCYDHTCYLVEKIRVNDTLYFITLIVNCITLLFFLILYFIEIIRENRLIKYLDVNNKLSTDNDEVEKVMHLLPDKYKNKILSIDKYYKVTYYICIGIYAINIFLSAIVSYYNMSDHTVIIFSTYTIIIITKFFNIYTIVNNKTNIFLSAYLITNVQFNDIEKQFKINYLATNIV
jgi:hypothetical protein